MTVSPADQGPKKQGSANKERRSTRRAESGSDPHAESGFIPGLNTLGRALEILPKLPTPVQAVLYLGVIVALLALVIGYELISNDQYFLGAGLVGFALIALVGDTFFAYRISMKMLDAAALRPSPSLPTKRPAPSWSRLVLKLPLPDPPISDLARDLRSIRDEAVSWLAGNGHLVDPKNIRANVFLPDYNDRPLGEVCSLAMPPQLRINMDGHPDANMRFSINQGLTGMVFLNFSRPQWAQIGSRSVGQTLVPKEHRLTAEQIETLHPELRWIIGLPLIIRDGDHRRAAGVLNVDGLEFHDQRQ